VKLPGPVGFGLAELLVAIVILGIGIIAVAGLVSTTGGRTRSAAWQTERVIVAHQEMERAARAPFDSIGSTIDSTVTSMGTYILDRSVTSLVPDLKRLDLSTSGPGATSPLLLSLIVVRPTSLP